MSENHERAMMDMEATHGATLATLQEEHTRTIKSESYWHPSHSQKIESTVSSEKPSELHT